MDGSTGYTGSPVTEDSLRVLLQAHDSCYSRLPPAIQCDETIMPFMLDSIQCFYRWFFYLYFTIRILSIAILMAFAGRRTPGRSRPGIPAPLTGNREGLRRRPAGAPCRLSKLIPGNKLRQWYGSRYPSRMAGKPIRRQGRIGPGCIAGRIMRQPYQPPKEIQISPALQGEATYTSNSGIVGNG